MLDPFSGSGTTAAAAYQLGRDYTCVEISSRYVAKAKRRLEELKKRRSVTSSLSAIELTELRRLLQDIQKTPKEIVCDKKLFKLFVGQFLVRTNTKRRDSEEQILKALEELVV